MSDRRVWAACLIAAVLGCAPVQTYPGPERARSETALLTGSARATVVAIDGARASGGSWSLLPGRHDILLRVRLATRVPNATWRIWSYCSVTLDAAPGGEYKSLVETHSRTGPGMYSEQLQVEIGIVDAAGTVQARVWSCSASPPALED